jgi:hypothetical protein
MANMRAHTSRLVFKGCECLKCYVWPRHKVLLSSRYRTGLDAGSKVMLFHCWCMCIVGWRIEGCGG